MSISTTRTRYRFPQLLIRYPYSMLKLSCREMVPPVSDGALADRGSGLTLAEGDAAAGFNW
jgi:hypothetical protein